jgi:prepilin-type N-terminal cleavage/methylation domain-containing protein/prepilin-type processing-associated H-X9-DG protein
MDRVSQSTYRGFTLVELLVVMGVIAVLVSMLMPALSAARRQANRAACAAALREIGNGFNLYAHDERGYWPMSVHQWTAPDGSSRERRWIHCVSKYLLSTPLNVDGTNSSAEAAIKYQRTVIRGCPSWDRVAYNLSMNSISYDGSANIGYAMNHLTFAPAAAPAGTDYTGKYANVSYRGLPWTATSSTANGWYYKAVQWKQPAERALVFDNTHQVASIAANWPWWTSPAGPMPVVPIGVSLTGNSLTVDFNRHGPRARGNRENDKTVNMLFCDGHVDAVSAREAFKAIRFK